MESDWVLGGVEESKQPGQSGEGSLDGPGWMKERFGGNLLSRKLYMHYHRQCGV